MKNEFFGDISDYRKYGLLRILSGTRETEPDEVPGIKATAAVCWMLTPDEGRPTNTDYLGKRGKWRRFDERLFDALHQAVIVDRERNVARAEHPDILDPALIMAFSLEKSNQLSGYPWTSWQRHLTAGSQFWLFSSSLLRIPQNLLTEGCGRYFADFASGRLPAFTLQTSCSS